MTATNTPTIDERSISGELYREVEVIDGTKSQTYRILNPLTLYSRVGGTTFRILDEAGIVHLVPVPGRLADGSLVVHRWKPRNPDKPVQF